MSLRSAITASPDETFSDLAWAAEQRFRDGEALLTLHRYGSAVYMHGLASEMWLKLASAKLLSLGPSATLIGFLNPVRRWMRLNAATIDCESYHSLLFWAEHLRRRRIVFGNPLSSELSGQLRHHVVNRLFEDWKIEMRYRTVSISELDALRVYNDTIWLRQTWDRLWR